MKKIILGDNLEVLKGLPDKFARLIYVDPPFSTGKVQQRTRIKTRSVEEGETGDRVGFGGKEYISEVQEEASNIYYEDKFDDFEAFLMPRIEASLHCLTGDGSIFIHLDQREVHYIKVAMDRLIGRDKFCQHIIWSYNWGGRGKSTYPKKHDDILWYNLNPKNYVFNYDVMDRVPYMSGEGLVGKEKFAKGTTITDVWWHTIVPTNPKSKEKIATGNYPTAKPLGILKRIVKMHSMAGDTVLDFFAGSGTTGQAAEELGREYCLIDSNPDAITVMKNRLPNANVIT